MYIMDHLTRYVVWLVSSICSAFMVSLFWQS